MVSWILSCCGHDKPVLNKDTQFSVTKTATELLSQEDWGSFPPQEEICRWCLGDG